MGNDPAGIGQSDPAVAGYLDSLFGPEDAVLAEIRQRASREGLPEIAVARLDGRHLDRDRARRRREEDRRNRHARGLLRRLPRPGSPPRRAARHVRIRSEAREGRDGILCAGERREARSRPRRPGGREPAVDRKARAVRPRFHRRGQDRVSRLPPMVDGEPAAGRRDPGGQRFSRGLRNGRELERGIGRGARPLQPRARGRRRVRRDVPADRGRTGDGSEDLWKRRSDGTASVSRPAVQPGHHRGARARQSRGAAVRPGDAEDPRGALRPVAGEHRAFRRAERRRRRRLCRGGPAAEGLARRRRDLPRALRRSAGSTRSCFRAGTGTSRRGDRSSGSFAWSRTKADRSAPTSARSRRRRRTGSISCAPRTPTSGWSSCCRALRWKTPSRRAARPSSPAATSRATATTPGASKTPRTTFDSSGSSRRPAR